MGRARVLAVAVLGAAALVGGPLLALTGGATPGQVKAQDDDVHLNQIQVIGSHNSYHQLPSPAEVAIRHQFLGQGDEGLTYQARPLAEQFQSQKVRQIELDVFLDPKGGKYADPLLRSVAGGGPYDPVMAQPGLKVMHVQDVDYVSSCLTLKACLGQVKTWSDANPSHVPIAILLELKDDEVPFSGFDFVKPDLYTAANLGTVDDEIRTVFSEDEMITPDDIRGTHATLEEAVTTDGWPSLTDSRGKVMFLMDNGGHYRTDYLAGHPSLAGRVLFTNSNPGQADAAFVERNDAHDPSIPGLVKAGYVVRSRADGDTSEARANDTSDRDAALASGAQWVSTDYPVPGLAIGFTSPYFAEIPGGTVARCNPVNAPASCTSGPLDTIFTPVDLPAPPTTTAPPVTEVPPPADGGPGLPVSSASGARPVRGQADFTG